MKKLFKLRGELSKKTETLIGFGGLFIILLTWYLLTSSGLVSSSILPNPIDVLKSFKTLHFDKFLVVNTFYSLKYSFDYYYQPFQILINGSLAKNVHN